MTNCILISWVKSHQQWRRQWLRSALTQGNGLKELSLLNKNDTAEFRTKTEGKNCTNKQKNFALDVIYILRVFARKKLFISLKPCRKTGRCFEERLRGGKLFKNWQIFWMNNRTIIELGFRMAWGFMQLRSCYPPTLTTTSAINTPITFPGFSSERGCKHLLDLHNHVAFVTYHGYKGRVHWENHWELNRRPGPCGSFD